MFEILFGWRKASKCKKLIRRVQCRLKLLKNKRCSIVRQLRDDVAQLLKYGHDQSAFDRVEQLFKDESIVTVYDLLDNFCEFILIHLSYIRRHKDCPNDINEAISSLIFASARCGDLPELPVIRKLFGERYGQRFAVAALNLLPGNLVNRQIRDSLSIKSVSNEVKYKLVDEIARSCLPLAPLALEYHPEEYQPADKSRSDQVPNSDVQTSHKKYEESQLVVDGKIVHVDISSEENKFSTSLHACPNTVNSLMHKRWKEGEMDEDSSSEGLSHIPEEMIYLDDIEEFQSPMSEDGKDQRLFVFKSTAIPTIEKIYIESLNEKSGSRSYRKSGKENGKRLRKRSFSWEKNRSVRDAERELYYSETGVQSWNFKSNHPRKHHKKKEIEDNRKRCSLDRPYYACVSDSLNRKLNHEKTCDNLICATKEFEGETLDCLGNRNGAMSACSRGGGPLEMKESKHPYLRAVTMPIERPKDGGNDNILRSNSFPINSSSPHVHPKLPDYDELAARFTALKKANLQNKRI